MLTMGSTGEGIEHLTVGENDILSGMVAGTSTAGCCKVVEAIVGSSN